MATKPQNWEDLLSPEELADFKAGKYGGDENGKGIPAKDAPKESNRVKRDKNLVAYTPAYGQHQPGYVNENGTFRTGPAPHLAQIEKDEPGNDSSEPTATRPRRGHDALSRPLNEEKALDRDVRLESRQAIQAVEALAVVPANCVLCGTRLTGDQEQKRVTIVLHDGADKDKAVVYCSGCFEGLHVQTAPADDWATGLTEEELNVWNLYTSPDDPSQKEVAEQLGLHPKKVSRIITKVQAARQAKKPRTPPDTSVVN